MPDRSNKPDWYWRAGEDHATGGHIMRADERTAADGTELFAGAAWFDLIEAGLRD